MSRVYAIGLSSLVTAPIATALWLLLVSRPNLNWGTLAAWIITTIPALVLCAALATVFGLPTSLLLDRLGLSSRVAYITAGSVVSTLGAGAFVLYDWCCVRSGPFSLSFRDKVEILGGAAVAMSYLRGVVFGLLCGAVAGNAFWIGLRRAVRSNNSLDRTLYR